MVVDRRCRGPVCEVSRPLLSGECPCVAGVRHRLGPDGQLGGFLSESAAGADPERHLRFWAPVVFPRHGGRVFNSVGLWLLLRLLGRTLTFRPSLLLSGGKGALRPFNQLLWKAWRYFMAVIVRAGVSTVPVRGKGVQLEDAILWIVIALLLALQLSSQRPINRLLAVIANILLQTRFATLFGR